jgi:Putative Ig domain
VRKALVISLWALAVLAACNNGSKTITEQPTITSASTTTFVAGTAGNFQVTTTAIPTAAITESGALPTGVTLHDNGDGTSTLGGTPAANSGGKYDLSITASNGISPSATQTFTLTVNDVPLIGSSNTATFAVGQTQTFTVTATGYPAPSIAESGALPNGVTFNAGTGVLSGTPAAGTENSYPMVFTASNGVGSNYIQNFTLVVVVDPCAGAGAGSESLLKGQYAFLLKGFDNGSATGETQREPVIIGGVFTFDGSGAVTTGTMDMNTSSSAGVLSQTVTGTYKVGGDGRACISISSEQGTQHYRTSLGNVSTGVASLGHMIDFDATGPFTAGIMKKQDSSAFNTSQVTGNYVFGISSIQNSSTGGGKFGAVGALNFSVGSITGGEMDFNNRGELDGNSANTTWPGSPISVTAGTYSVSSTTGRGLLQFTPSGASQVNAILYVVSAAEVFVMANDDQTSNSGSLYAGELLQQSGTPFSANPLSGSYVGYDSGTSYAGGNGRTDIYLLGPMISGNNGLAGTGFRNDSDRFSYTNISGTYAVDSAGRMNVSGSNSEPILYLASTTQAFILAGNTSVDSGVFESQSGDLLSVSGSYAFGTTDPQYAGPITSGGTSVTSGIYVFASPNLAGTEDGNADGSLGAGIPLSLTYSLDSGFGTIPSGCTTSPAVTCMTVFYMISPTKAVFMDLANSDVQIRLADQ